MYRIYYGEHIVYVGRTKQPLQDRIRGHLFAKPMHRTIAIEQVTKIEYVEFQTEADMNLYEIYFILQLHPALNVDDKANDYPTVTLPPVEWHEFKTPLWEKWIQQISEKCSEHEKLLRRYNVIPEEIRVVRAARRTGEIDEETCDERVLALKREMDTIREQLRR